MTAKHVVCFARTAKHVWPALPGKKYAVRMGGFTGIDSVDAWMALGALAERIQYPHNMYNNTAEISFLKPYLLLYWEVHSKGEQPPTGAKMEEFSDLTVLSF